MAAEDKFPLELESDRYSLELYLAADNTECYLSLTPTGENPVTPEELSVLVAEKGIVRGVDADALNRVCEAAARGETVENILIAKTTRAQSIDGRIEFLALPSQDRPAMPEENEKKQVDYRNTNLFENVYRDQPLAIIHKASKQDGLTVTGREVIVKPGREVFVQCGDGAKKVENGRKIIATKDGRVVYEHDKISVSDYLVVDFDVDYHVGHIDFVGLIRVGGDVKDGFNISGKRGVQIDGTVGVCRVESQGDIKLGGMAGAKKQEAQIRCGGMLTANYLHGVNIECQGDLTVSYEMLHCVVMCKGAILAQGNVSGGEYSAANGIEIETVGSELGVTTRLASGIEDKTLSSADKLGQELRAVNTQLERIVKQLDPLRRNPKAIAGSDRLKRLAAELLQEYQTLSKRKNELDQEVQSVQYEEQQRINKIRAKANAKINIHRKLFHGTVVELDGTVEKFRNDLTGPISIINNSKESGLRVLPMTSLSTNARDVEKSILAKEA
jgi:hypothetical protein